MNRTVSVMESNQQKRRGQSLPAADGYALIRAESDQAAMLANACQQPLCVDLKISCPASMREAPSIWMKAEHLKEH